jgi:hypothetical protein
MICSPKSMVHVIWALSGRGFLVSDTLVEESSAHALFPEVRVLRGTIRGTYSKCISPGSPRETLGRITIVLEPPTPVMAPWFLPSPTLPGLFSEGSGGMSSKFCPYSCKQPRSTSTSLSREGRKQNYYLRQMTLIARGGLVVENSST